MSFHVVRSALFCLALLGMAAISRGGMTTSTPYTDRGKTDFDTALQLLNPYGIWSKIGGKWAFTPRDHLAPYTNGRWIYTEYGWYWKGRAPHSWATEHYGYWKRGADNIWSWYPGPYWLPETVEIRATHGYIGWRSSEVDDDGNFVDPPIDRYSKMDEWTFVTLAQFANPITPEIIAPPDVAKTQLEESTDCRHTYLTYREIDRPGPHPADVADLCKDGGMLAPKTMRDELAAKTQPPPSSAMLATNTAAAITNGTNAPALLGTETDPTADTRKVKYWITMSLPTFSTPPPPDAKREEIYLYRPDFYQDQDGIERRITLWFNPNARTTLTEALGENAPHGPGTTTNAVNTPTIPASPATPASQETASAHNPFHSPLDDSFQPGSATTNRPANSSTKNPAPAPSGLITPDAPATNAAPANGN